MRSLLTLCLFGMALSAASAETVDNPMYMMWKGFGPGSSATYQMVTMAGGNKSEVSSTVTLVSINDTECVTSTENTMTVAGAPPIKTPAYPMTIPAKIEVEKPAAEQPSDAPKPKTETSQDTVEIAGEKLECTKTTVAFESNGMKSESAYWVCTKVPGHTVKTVTKTSGTAESSMEMTLTAYTAK